MTSVSFDVPINDDRFLELNELLVLSIVTTLPNRVTLGDHAQAIVNILDNDRKSIYIYKLHNLITVYMV